MGSEGTWVSRELTESCTLYPLQELTKGLGCKLKVLWEAEERPAQEGTHELTLGGYTGESQQCPARPV